MFPLDRYKYFTNGTTEVIAKSTFAGKRYYGKATCDPSDKFDLEKGKQLAASKCNLKICEKRFKRAEESYNEALKLLEKAKKLVDNEKSYLDMSKKELDEAVDYNSTLSLNM